MYYISSDVENEFSEDSDLGIVKIKKRRVGGGSGEIVAFCSCGLSSFPSSLCRPSVTKNPNGSITGTCYTEGCNLGCSFHSSTETSF